MCWRNAITKLPTLAKTQSSRWLRKLPISFIFLCVCVLIDFCRKISIYHITISIYSQPKIYTREICIETKKKCFTFNYGFGSFARQEKKKECIDTQFDCLAENPFQSKVFFTFRDEPKHNSIWIMNNLRLVPSFYNLSA